ncbi:Thioredoxin-like fold [Phaffia rhodozyma]|uniref:Thioredoxin-like fold n=1 Tax=Phaffia rhodozyma TaxID=264483 RepID=A0A0F7SUI9_PHARH|nr:Thioredoxin-like fold [Phaffia rhodozyma]
MAYPSMLPQFTNSPPVSPQLPASPRFHSPKGNYFGSFGIPSTPALSDGYESSDSESSGPETPRLGPKAWSTAFGANQTSSRKSFPLAANPVDFIHNIDDEQDDRERRRRRRGLAHGSNRTLKTMAFGPSFSKAKRSQFSRYAFYALTAFLVIFTFNRVFRPNSPTDVSLESNPSERVSVHSRAYQNSYFNTKRVAPNPETVRAIAKTRQAISKRSLFKWADERSELSSVLNFIITEEMNALPANMDPTSPVDPEVVLDFDPYTSTAEGQLIDMEVSFWETFPIVLVYRYADASAKKIQSQLDQLHIHPAPVTVDLEARSDAAVITPLVQRLVDYPIDQPMLFIGGELIGGLTEIQDLKESKLKSLIRASGAKIMVPKRRRADDDSDVEPVKTEAELEIEAERQLRSQYEEERKMAEAVNTESI